MSLIRRHVAFLVVLGAGALLRVYGLAWLPSPAGDEGNWTLYAWRLMRGGSVELAPDAAFVSLLYPRLMAAAMEVFGAGFWAGRIVGVVAVLLAVTVAYAVPARLGSRAAGLGAAAVLALHPWSVLYSRTASVPYDLALAAGTVGPLALVFGLSTRRATAVAAGVLVVGVGAHFSPLSVIAAAGCLVFAARRENRWIFTHWMPWAAVALTELHVLPVVRGAAEVARTAPPLPQLEDFVPNLGRYLHMMGTGLAGEATLRHFTNTALGPWVASALVVPVAALVILAGSRSARRASPTAGFGRDYLLVALLLTPVILAPARNWFLPANHMDRYLFSVLPGFALLVGDLLARPGRRGRWLAAACLVWLALGCTGRAAWAFLGSGGVDHGETVFEGGGGYRGWLVTETPEPLPDQIVETVLERVGPGGATVLYVDRAFIPLHFAARGRLAVEDVRRQPIPERPDGRYFAVLYPDSVLSLDDPPTAPPKYVRANQRLRERLEKHFSRLELVRTLEQRDGSPLVEIWRAEEPTGRLSPLFQ